MFCSREELQTIGEAGCVKLYDVVWAVGGNAFVLARAMQLSSGCHGASCRTRVQTIRSVARPTAPPETWKSAASPTARSPTATPLVVHGEVAEEK